VTKQNRSLKSRNIKWMATFVVYNLAVYAAFTTGTVEFWTKLDSTFQAMNAGGALAAVIAPVLSIVLQGIISAEMKGRIIFLRWRNALPGHRAFSQYAQSDPRIDINHLSSKLGGLPQDPSEQNQIWFQLLKKHSDQPAVDNAHQVFLLTRDIMALSLLLLVFGGISYIIQGISCTNLLWYAVYMISQALLTGYSANQYGKRLVTNVIACETNI